MSLRVKEVPYQLSYSTINLVLPRGFEPPRPLRSLGSKPSVSAFHHRSILAGRQGIEPCSLGPKPSVLPLDHQPIFFLCIKNLKYFFNKIFNSMLLHCSRANVSQNPYKNHLYYLFYDNQYKSFHQFYL